MPKPLNELMRGAVWWVASVAQDPQAVAVAQEGGCHAMQEPRQPKAPP